MMLLNLFVGMYLMSSLPVYLYTSILRISNYKSKHISNFFPCILPYIAMHYEN